MKDFKAILSKKKILVFDLDGTIVRLKVNWSHLRKLLSERFFTIYGEKRTFTTVTECFNEIMARQDDAELKNLFQIVEEYELTNIENAELIEETIYFLNNLDQFGITKHVHLAILSLNMHETIKKSLILANLDDKFHFIIGKENVRNWKPHPSGLLKIKEHFGVSSNDMIYFGDLKKDIETGENAGVSAFLIDHIIELVKGKNTCSQ